MRMRWAGVAALVLSGACSFDRSGAGSAQGDSLVALPDADAMVSPVQDLTRDRGPRDRGSFDRPPADSSGPMTKTLGVAGDTYVNAHDPTTNFGTAEDLKVALWGGTGYRDTYLDFGLGSTKVKALHQADLKLFVSSVGSAGQTSVVVHGVTAAWGEKTITYDSAPPVDLSASCSVSLPQAFKAYNVIDVRVPLSACLAQRGGCHGLRLRSQTGNASVDFASKESQTYKTSPPTLVVTYTPK